jgi:hypothetical protein
MGALREFIGRLYGAFDLLVDMTEAAEGGHGSRDINICWGEVQEPLVLLFKEEKTRCDTVFEGALRTFVAASAASAASAGGAAALAASAASAAPASAGGAAAAAEPENRKNTGTGRRNSRRRRRATSTSTLRRTRKNTH